MASVADITFPLLCQIKAHRRVTSATLRNSSVLRVSYPDFASGSLSFRGRSFILGHRWKCVRRLEATGSDSSEPASGDEPEDAFQATIEKSKKVLAMQRNLLQQRLVAISRCGHLPHEECPKALLTAMTPFITRHESINKLVLYCVFFLAVGLIAGIVVFISSSRFGLNKGLITFTRLFSPEAACEVIEAERHSHVFYEAEPDIWMVMVVEKNKETGAVWRIDALRKVLKEVHSLFVMFHGSVRALIEKDPTGELTRSQLYPFITDYLSNLYIGKKLQHLQNSLAEEVVEGTGDHCCEYMVQKEEEDSETFQVQKESY